MNPAGLLKALSIPSEVWTGLATAVALIAGVGYMGKSCELSDLREEKVEETRRADSLAAEAAAQRAREAGWEVAFGENVEHLHATLEGRDSALQALGQDLQASRARVEQLTELTIELRGSGESEADSTVTAEGDSIPTEWSGTYDDGVLTANWTFNRGPPRSFLYVRDWWASVGIDLVQAETGDGRTLVTARTSHPDRVQARIDSLIVDRPPPVVRETGLSWWWPVVSFAGGALASEADLFSKAWDTLF